MHLIQYTTHSYINVIYLPYVCEHSLPIVNDYYLDWRTRRGKGLFSLRARVYPITPPLFS